jgi:hypothetical protein
MIIMAAFALSAVAAVSRDWSVKTNLLSDATLSPAASAEMTVAPKWSVELSGSLNAWTLSGGEKRWKHWAVQPEARYWFCRPYAGHFVGAHLLGGQYNIGGLDMGFKFLGTDFGKLKDYRYQGWFAGAGIAYGYSWILDRHWNLEAEIGFGWTYTRYDRFECRDCGKRLESDRPHNYVGPTKAAINLVYVF